MTGDAAPQTVEEWPEYAEAMAGQGKAALPQSSAFVAANAGSGKTKVLIDRVARLLLLPGAKPDEILCVTYTKAAASEMQTRLFQRLGAWCVMDAARLQSELGALEGRRGHAYTPEEIGRARELFAQALETPGGLRIETIHAFCARLLRRFPLEAGVPPGFGELDDEDASALWDAAFEALGARLGRREQTLVEAARIAAEAGGAKGLAVLRSLHARREEVRAFIAGAGGVEPAVEALRLEIGAGHDRIDTLISNAMNRDLPRERLSAAVAGFRTGSAQDRAQADCIGFALSDAPPDERLDGYIGVVFAATGALKSRGRVFTNGVRDRHPAVADLFDVEVPQGSETLRLIQLRSALNARRTFDRSAALLRLAHVVFSDYARRKRARASLDFEDLIETVGRLLNQGSAAEWVLWKLDGGLSHILLDEAQDTSLAQWGIVDTLTRDFFSGSSAERRLARTLFVVGDHKQSIYSFQGADPEHFLSQTQAFEQRTREANVEAELPNLAMSFRSTPEVLAFVDAAFDTLALVSDATFTANPPAAADLLRHTAHRRHQPGSVELWPIEPRPEVEPAEPWDAPIGQEKAASAKQRLARSVAEFIKREIDDGSAVWHGDVQRPARPGDFLILVKGRTGGLFDALLQALKRANLPVAGADRLQLLESLPVQDLLNLVRFALCPDDDLTLAEILKGPFGGLDDDGGLFPLANGRAPGETLWRRLEVSDDPHHARVRTFLRDVSARRHAAPFEFLSDALERGHGLGRSGWDLILSRFGGPAREPVTALIDRAARFDADTPPSLELFLAAIERHGGELKRELSGPQDEVRVMTVHGAKGLEAPVVILPDTTSAPNAHREGWFLTKTGAPIWAAAKATDAPLTACLRELADAHALNEHRRLLYVALTRARDRLVVCGAFMGKTAPGRSGASWYAVCETAMARLVESGQAFVADEGGRTVMRLGATAPHLGAGALDDVSHALPRWLRQPVRAEPVRERLLSPSALGDGEPPGLVSFEPGRAARLRRGRLIHVLLQALPDVEPKRRRKAGRDHLSRQPDLSASERREILGAAMSVSRSSSDPAAGPKSRLSETWAARS